MADCVIKRGEGGRIRRVSTPTGERSVLFDKIAGIATISDMGKAADAYMTTYNDKFISRFGDWVSNAKEGGLRSALRFRTSSRLFEEYPTWLSGQTTSTGQHSTLVKDNNVRFSRLSDFDGRVSESDYRKISESKGWYDTETDTVTVVADNIESEEDLERTVLHEVMAHKGLRGLLGDRFDDTMVKVFDSMDEASQEAYLGRYGDRVIAAEEFMATMAETDPDVSIWDKIISFVRDALRSMGMDIKISDTDMRTLLVRSKDRLSEIDKELDKPISQIDGRLTYENGEPRLFFMSDDGKIYQGYGEAVRGSSGGRVRAGFLAGTVESVEDNVSPPRQAAISFIGSTPELNDKRAFIPILSVSTETGITTRMGFVNYLIKKGMLSGERVRLGDKYYLTGEGNSDGLKIHNATRALYELQNMFGGDATINPLGSVDFDIRTDPGTVEMTDRDGNSSSMDKSEIKAMIRQGRYQELDRMYDGMPGIVASLIMDDNAIYEDDTWGLVEDAKAEDAQNRTDVLNILSTLGIRVMGMTEYMERYKTRNGVEPSARALSDMANGVIALAEGATLSDLHEEIAHFLVDTYRNQQEIDEILPGVRDTVQWNTYAARYYEVYGKDYSGEELDRMVEREILGKILSERFYPGMQNGADTAIDDAPVSLFRRMVNAIRGFFTGQRQDLDKVLDRIRASALANDPNAFDVLLLKDSDHLMYSLSDKDAAMRMLREKRTLERQYRNLRRLKARQQHDVKGDIKALKDIEERMKGIGEELDRNSVVFSTKSVVATARAQVEYMVTVAKALKQDKGRVLDYETAGIIDNVFGTMVPMIKNLRGFVNNQSEGYYGDDTKPLVREMEEIISIAENSMSDIRSIISQNDNFIDDRLEAMMIPKSARAMIKQMILAIQKDITGMTRFFGTLEHSGNPLLGMLGRELADLNERGRKDGIKTIRKMNKLLKDRGWTVKDSENIIQRNPDGSMSDYIESSRDKARYDLNYRRRQAEAIIDIYDLESRTGRERQELMDELMSDKGMAVEVREEIVGYEDDNTTPIRRKVKAVFKPNIQGMDTSLMSIEDRDRFDRMMDDWKEQNSERPMTQEYYEMMDRIREKIEKKLGRKMLDESRAFLARIRRERYAKTEAFIKDGKVDWVALSSDPIAWREYQDISRDRAIAKSRYHANGIRKEVDSEAYKIAQDIVAWDEVWAEERSDDTRKATDEFKAMLRAVEANEGGKAAMEFLLAGGHMGFSKDMWGSESDLGYYEDLATQVLNMRTLTPTMARRRKEVLDSYTEISRIRERLKNLLLPYRDYSRFGEYDFDRLLSSSRIHEINDLYDTLTFHKRNLSASARSLGIETEFSEGVEMTMTESYKNALADSGMDELRFALGNMSAADNDETRKFVRFLHDPKPAYFKESYRRFLTSYLGDIGTLKELKKTLTVEKVNDLATAYARTKVYPYMRRYTPRGYSEFVDNINNGTVSVSEFFEARESGISAEDSVNRFGFDVNMIDLHLNNQWMTEAEGEVDMRNPDYDRSLGYGYQMPRKDLYRDDRYYEKYGIIEEKVDDGTGRMVTVERATRNIDKWEMRNAFLEVSRNSMADYDEGMRDIHTIPQISKGWVERLQQVGVDAKGAVENLARDIISNRVDDPLHGQTSDLALADDGDDIYRTIPKYYITTLEERSDVSHDFGYSYSMLGMQAAMYKNKRQALGTVMGYKNKMLEQEYDGGKAPESTRTYRMFVDWVNASIYDVRINNKRIEWNIGNYKVDINKVALAWTKFVSITNLGLSPFVALTGALTGQANFLLEGIVGQNINTGSMRYAYGEVQKQLGSYLDEVGEVNRENKLYVMGERIGIFNVRNRVASAGYNKIWRTLFRDVPFKLMEVLNSPLDPQVMISVMDDTRLYNGEFYAFEHFKDMCVSERNMTVEQAREEWEGMRDSSLWNLTDAKDGEIVAKDPANQVAVDRYMPTVSARVRSLVQICDGALNEQNRVGASRNALFNMVLPHRGWLILAAQRAFKKKGYNFQTMRFEKGYDRSLLHLMNQVYKTMSEGRMAEIYQVLKEEYHKLDEYEQNNVKRAIINLAMCGVFFCVGRALMGYREDNEDSWFAQFVAYTGFRVINEMASQITPFMELNAVDMVQDPLVTARKLGDLVDIRNWDPFSTVQTGVYKGESKLMRQLMKFSFGKQWYNIKSARDIKQTSDYWLMTNNMTAMFFFGGQGDTDTDSEPNWFF